MTTRLRRFRAIGTALCAALGITALALMPSTLAHAEEEDPGLQQTIDPNQAQGTGRVVLDDGHIDYGPTLNTGEWIIQIHDDTSSPSYWRMLSDVVAKVSDVAKLTVPDSEAYAFLGLEPGTEAWVIPQVRQPGVVWAGWNTQEPTVLDSLSFGTTQRILGVDGPGEVTVYLQAGNFGEPQLLWSTLDAFPQESFIEVNTHTHANWVFSEPGIYLVEMEFEGDLIDGTHVIARDTMRFAVGDATDAEAAFDMQFDESLLAQGPSTGEEPEGESEGKAGEAAQGDGLGLLVGAVVGIVGAALIIALIVVVLAGRRAKARARAARTERAAERESVAGERS